MARSTLAGSIHPFVLADVIGITRFARHTDESVFLIDQFRELLETAEQHYALRATSTSNYFFSRGQITKIRAADYARRRMPPPNLHHKPELAKTTALRDQFNKLVSLGLISATPTVFEVLPLVKVQGAPAGSHPMPLSAWVELGKDAHGFSIYNSPTGWPEGTPYCFDVHIPGAKSKSGSCAIAPVVIENDLFTPYEPAVTFTDAAREAVERTHIYDHHDRQLLYVRGLDPTDGARVLVRNEDGAKVSLDAAALLARAKATAVAS